MQVKAVLIRHLIPERGEVLHGSMLAYFIVRHQAVIRKEIFVQVDSLFLSMILRHVSDTGSAIRYFIIRGENKMTFHQIMRGKKNQCAYMRTTEKSVVLIIFNRIRFSDRTMAQ